MVETQRAVKVFEDRLSDNCDMVHRFNGIHVMFLIRCGRPPWFWVFVVSVSLITLSLSIFPLLFEMCLDMTQVGRKQAWCSYIMGQLSTESEFF